MFETPTSYFVLELARDRRRRAADHDEDAQQQGSGDAAELFRVVLRAGAAADCFWRSWRLGIATSVIILDECALHLCESLWLLGRRMDSGKLMCETAVTLRVQLRGWPRSSCVYAAFGLDQQLPSVLPAR